MSRRYKIKEETIDRGVDEKRLYFIPEYKDSFFEVHADGVGNFAAYLHGVAELRYHKLVSLTQYDVFLSSWIFQCFP